MEFPEIPYSRIPASTLNELLTALQKAFELDGPAARGPWGNSIVLAADDEWGSRKTEDEHTQTCDFLADSVLNQSLNIIKHYLIDYPGPRAPPERVFIRRSPRPPRISSPCSTRVFPHSPSTVTVHTIRWPARSSSPREWSPS